MIKYLISDLDSILENIEFVNSLKENLSLGKILFVASNPKEEQITRMYGERIISSFYKNEISFSGVDYIYDSTNIDDVKSHINEYSLIFLMGGITLIQNEFMLKIDLKSVLEEYNGTVMGMSAGALNMCEVTLDSAYFGDSEKTVLVKGLGLVDIVVDVHFSLDNETQVKEIKRTGLKVYCIPNNGAIKFENKNMKKYGNIYLCENEEITIKE